MFLFESPNMLVLSSVFFSVYLKLYGTFSIKFALQIGATSSSLNLLFLKTWLSICVKYTYD